jgi:signal peptidase II
LTVTEGGGGAFPPARVAAKLSGHFMTGEQNGHGPPKADHGKSSMPDTLASRVQRISRWMYVLIGLMVFAGDQATKMMVVESIPDHAIVPVIPHLLNLTNVSNAGAAFGLFSDSPSPWKTAMLIFLSAALLAAVVSFVWKARRLQWEAAVGLALILGGAISNLLDRIRVGRVVDFLDLYVRNYHWYTFNLADSAIVVGACFLILQVVSSD